MLHLLVIVLIKSQTYIRTYQSHSDKSASFHSDLLAADLQDLSLHIYHTSYVDLRL